MLMLLNLHPNKGPPASGGGGCPHDTRGFVPRSSWMRARWGRARIQDASG
jgi:hypothetical protein